jgi:hypothetical protein
MIEFEYVIAVIWCGDLSQVRITKSLNSELILLDVQSCSLLGVMCPECDRLE